MAELRAHKNAAGAGGGIAHRCSRCAPCRAGTRGSHKAPAVSCCGHAVLQGEAQGQGPAVQPQGQAGHAPASVMATDNSDGGLSDMETDLSSLRPQHAGRAAASHAASQAQVGSICVLWHGMPSS